MVLDVSQLYQLRKDTAGHHGRQWRRLETWELWENEIQKPLKVKQCTIRCKQTARRIPNVVLKRRKHYERGRKLSSRCSIGKKVINVNDFFAPEQPDTEYRYHWKRTLQKLIHKSKRNGKKNKWKFFQENWVHNKCVLSSSITSTILFILM